MKLWIFAFISFLFYQIFPSLANFGPNNPVSALIMAITVSAICWGSSLQMVRSAVDAIRQFERSPFLGNFHGLGLLVWGAAVIASMAICYLVAVGFAPKLLHFPWSEPKWLLWFMFSLPPAALMGSEFFAARAFAAKALEEFRESRARRDPRW